MKSLVRTLVNRIPLNTAKHANRGELRYEEGTGVADALYFGRRNAAGDYEWTELTDQSGGGGGAVSSVSDTGSIDLTLSGGALSADIKSGSGVTTTISTAARAGSFTLTDAALSSSKRVLIWRVPAVGQDADELEMDQLTANAGTPGSGSCTVYWTATPGPVIGTLAFRYLTLGT